MAVSLKVSSLKPEVLQQIYTDLTLIAKGLKTKGYKPRVSQLAVFDDTPEEVTIPLVYARNKFQLKGLRDARAAEFKTLKPEFRTGQTDVFRDAISYLKRSGSVFLQLHCGYGKTWLALHIAAHMGSRVMFLVHRRFLAMQFLTEAENVMPGQLRFIDDCDVDENTPGSAFICTDIRARKLPEAFRKTIDFIVVDEAKYWCTPERVKSMLCFRPIYSMGLCAERERKDGFDQVLSLFFGTNIFRKSVKPFKIWKLKTQFEPTIEQQTSRRGINWMIASQSLAFMDERNIIIRDLCRLRSCDKIMILVQFVDHVMILKKMLEDVNESVSTFCGSKDSYKACRILVATYSKAEMGFDDQNICENFDGKRLNLLILGADYKKDIEQSVGRIMRTEAPEVFDIVDKFATLQKHSDIRDKWYRTRCGRVMPAEYIFSVGKKDE
jgi:hypothetical protein